ncbi:hypothetical protein B0H16DRAFT_1777138 [Mycena metata]|uniref:Uncharacterized protein n=1 Tax=Mycena metata TaxID=1033252 RepID=A0AAD7JR50_9AGAR|nr:hypothetical protein B0H16DRAFT_1777138 [Mycena metata]
MEALYGGLYNKPAYHTALDMWAEVVEEAGCSKAELAYRWDWKAGRWRPVEALYCACRRVRDGDRKEKGGRSGGAEQRDQCGGDETGDVVEGRKPGTWQLPGRAGQVAAAGRYRGWRGGLAREEEKRAGLRRRRQSRLVVRIQGFKMLQESPRNVSAAFFAATISRILAKWEPYGLRG